LSGFKSQLIDEVQKVFPLDKDHVLARNGNQFIRFELTYPTFFERQQALRPHLLLEFTITNLSLPGIYLPVSSLINELTKNPPEVSGISCVHPTENAADKLSALAWRIAERDRSKEDDDPSIVRHV